MKKRCEGRGLLLPTIPISMYLNNVVLWSKEVEFLVREMTCSCVSPVPNDVNGNILDEYTFCFYFYSQTDKT